MYKKDSLEIESKLFIEEGDPYFTKLNADWSNALSKAFENIENPNFRRLNGA